MESNPARTGNRRPVSIVLALVCAIGAGLWTGCSGGSSVVAPSTAKKVPAITATNSSIIAIDCKRQRAYVPLNFLNDNFHGQIAVFDLSVDPDKANPLITIIDIGLVALPRAAAVDIKSGTVLVLADDVVFTGNLLLINENDFSFTSVPLPAGSRPNETSGIVIDPESNTALVSMSDSVLDCTSEPGFCTGVAIFDLASQTFSPLYVTLNNVDSIALDHHGYFSLGTSDPLFSILLAFDLNVSTMYPCELDDDNVKTLFADPDGIAVDPTTDIWVAGNYESPLASVINLHGSSFSGPGTQDCHLNEGGAPPNSVNHDTGTGAAGMPGVAINPVTHKALMTAVANNQIALLNLPVKPVKQLTDKKVTSVSSTIPNNPAGLLFEAAEFPYGTSVDTCHNLGYVIDDPRTFMVQIDLAKFRKNPAAISTALPAGTCAAAATSFQCDNGNGIMFYPLPQPPVGTAVKPPDAMADPAFVVKKNAKKKELSGH